MHAPASFRRRRSAALAGGLALATVVLLAFALDLGRPDFWDPGESRYAEIVREMLASGNWLHPTLGFERYYDKPPAFFWIVAAAFETFGRHEWAARLPSALAAVATIGATVGFAWRRLGMRAALLAGFVLATAVQFVVLGRSVRMDMLLTWLMTATLLRAYAVLEPADDEPVPAAWPLYAFTAAGLLVKGPVAAVLPALIVAAFVVVTRTPLRRLGRLAPGAAGGAVIAALAAVYLVIAARAPDYLWTFLFQHNVGRYVGRDLAGHTEPIWYYVWILPVTFLPWTPFAPAAVHRVVRRARRGDRLTLFLAAWCAVPFLFFTVSRAKLATYLLPVFPALAMMVAAHLDVALRAAPDVRARVLRWPLATWTAGMVVVALGTPVGVAIAYGYARDAWPSLCLGVFPLLGWWALRRAAWRAAPALVIAAAVATHAAFYRIGAPVVDEFSSLRGAAEIASTLPPDAAVFAYKTRGHSFTYYGGRTVLRVRSPAAVAEVLARPAPTAALVKRRHLDAIRAHLRAPVCIWWESPSGRALLANVPRADHPPGARLVPVSETSGAAPDGIPPC